MNRKILEITSQIDQQVSQSAEYFLFFPVQPAGITSVFPQIQRKV